MKKLLMAIAGASILTLAACGGGGDKPDDKEPATPAPETEAPADNETPGATDSDATEGDATEGDAGGDVTYDAEAAEASYKSCAGCHGQNLEGASGPTLTGTGLSADEILDIIENGKGTMPAGLKTGDEAKNLAAWIAAQ